MSKGSQTEKAYESIHASIFDGTLFQGYPITEVELAEKLQMSRTPVREALSQLRSEGLLEYIPRKGVMVRQFSKQEILMAYEYTEALEGKLCSLLAARASELDLSGAWQRVHQMEAALQDGDNNAWVHADDKFHNELNDLCVNQFIVNALRSVYGQIYYTRMLVTRVMLDREQSTLEHRKTLQSIEAGDMEAARLCAEQHSRRIQQEVSRVL